MIWIFKMQKLLAQSFVNEINPVDKKEHIILCTKWTNWNSLFLSFSLLHYRYSLLAHLYAERTPTYNQMYNIYIYILYILKLHHWITTLTSESTNSTKCRIKYSSVNVDHDGTDEWWIFNCFFLFAVCLLRLESVICNANNKWLLKSCSIWVFLAWMVNSVRVVSVAAWSWFFFYLWLHIFRWKSI